MKHAVSIQSIAGWDSLWNYRMSGTEEIFNSDYHEHTERFRHFQIALTDEILKELDEEDMEKARNE